MKKVSVFLADGFEDVEALIPVDVWRRGGVDVTTVSITDFPLVRSAHGVNIEADMMFEQCDCSDADLLFLPGGMPGASNLFDHKGVCKAVLKDAYNPEAIELPSGDILLRVKDGCLYILSSDGECKKEIKNDDPQFDSYNSLFPNNRVLHEPFDIEIENIGDSEEHRRRFNKKPIAQWNCIGRGPSLLSAGRLYIHYGSCNRVDFLKLNYGSHLSVSFEQAKQFLNGDIKESDFVSYVPKSTD